MVHALDELQSLGERNLSRPRRVQVTPHCPRPFVVMRVSRQRAVRELDLTPIQKLAVRRERDEDRRVTVLGDADDRPLQSCSLGHRTGARL